MVKKEIIWREILVQARVNKKIKFTQQELAQKFGFSLSTVFNALKVPRQNHSLKVTGRFFILENYKKLLYLWATERSLKRDIIFEGLVNKDINELEAEVPADVVFGLYSAYKFLYHETPADYDHLYLYLNSTEIKKLQHYLNISAAGFASNVFLLTKDPWLLDYGKVIPPEQIFVDIWNSSEWYAKDFLKSLEEKLNL